MAALGSGEPAGQATAADPYRVMVVEDSLVIRGLMVRMLEAAGDIRVVASVGNGQLALDALSRARAGEGAREAAEVAVLDIEMPVMDGLTALPRLIGIDPDLKVVMASTLTRKGADVTVRALASGAADTIPKPSSAREVGAAEAFRRELVEKVRALGNARRRALARRRPVGARAAASGAASAAAAATVPLALRPPMRRVPSVLAIGSSTGGPQALFTLFGALGRVTQPVFVTQHMPPTFTQILAEHLGRVTPMPCSEARDGEAVAGGHVYVAPGDRHMTVVQRDGRTVVKLDDGPRENFCRPSVDPMLRSLCAVYRDGLLVTILTGMGQDGLQGARTVVAAGGAVIAQDEATSVVWGMPGAVARAGLCSAVLPIGEIAGQLTGIARRGDR